MKTAALTIVFALLSIPVAAQPVEYVYTKFDAKTCKHTKGKAEEDYGSWLCPGYRGLPVRLSAGDQRMYVTFGPRTKDNIAGTETFPGFNSVYEGTIEWRIEKGAGGRSRPFATILRWNLVRGSGKGHGPDYVHRPRAGRDAARSRRRVSRRLRGCAQHAGCKCGRAQARR